MVKVNQFVRVELIHLVNLLFFIDLLVIVGQTDHHNSHFCVKRNCEGEEVKATLSSERPIPIAGIKQQKNHHRVEPQDISSFFFFDISGVRVNSTNPGRISPDVCGLPN
ncbi:hypothetical protein Dimus_034465 [Dionaea muscipula]